MKFHLKDAASTLAQELRASWQPCFKLAVPHNHLSLLFQLVLSYYVYIYVHTQAYVHTYRYIYILLVLFPWKTLADASCNILELTC